MPLINCEINLIWTLSQNCVIFSPNGETKFVVSGTKRYVPIATLSTQNSAKLLELVLIWF